jgi:ribulose 1,5-bisphosphate synthetase/thiazole synthase
MSNLQTDSRDYDVISVGSGHHGLIAAAYLAGVDKFYLVGPFMHPGAGLTGAGRTTAMRILQDLDMDFDQAIGVEQPVAVAKEKR